MTPPPLQVLHAPVLSADLRSELVDIWVAATNAGGALGLTAPTDEVHAASLAGPLWRRVDDGAADLLVGYAEGRPVGWLVLDGRSGPLSPHWRTVKRLQVHPDVQGRGYGAALLAASADAGRRLGLEALHLTVRGGTGTEAFYAARGYREVGRIPRALRVAPGDDRDEIHMHLEL